MLQFIEKKIITTMHLRFKRSKQCTIYRKLHGEKKKKALQNIRQNLQYAAIAAADIQFSCFPHLLAWNKLKVSRLTYPFTIIHKCKIHNMHNSLIFYYFLMSQYLIYLLLIIFSFSHSYIKPYYFIYCP